MDIIPDKSDYQRTQQSSTFSDFSIGSNSTVIASPTSPTSPTVHRPGYQRVPSVVNEEEMLRKGTTSNDGTEGHGLGLSFLDTQKKSLTSRVPVGSKRSPNEPTSDPSSADPLISPSFSKSGESPYRHKHKQSGMSEEDTAYSGSHFTLPQAFNANSEHETLHRKSYSTPGMSVNPLTYERAFPCTTKKPLHVARSSWLAVSILVLSIYSTVLSGLWFFIAIIKPRYGHTITTAGRIPPGTASLLCAALAKTIELSFVTVFISFLGQLLSTRALVPRRGITLAEMSMRSWVMQPGTMITRWESVRYAATSVLGALALIAAIMAMFYTTASDALVAPKLNFGKTEHRLLYGKVATSFANPQYIQTKCNTPIQQKNDPDNYGQTCISIEHNAQALHNYYQYLTAWVEDISSGNSTANLTERPSPVGMINDNTTVTGSWIEIQNMTDLSAHYGRLTNNVTMAMPHVGVLAAAGDPRNNIVQPRDLSGLGEYYVQGSVPSPVVNVLCADMTEEDMLPMVYTLWPDKFWTNGTNSSLPNTTTWPNDFNLSLPDSLKSTVVDNLFGFNDVEVHPIFPKTPLPYNTVMNTTGIYGSNALYMLANSTTGNYTMCSIRAGLSPNCSTEYHGTMSDGFLSSRCEDVTNELAYDRSQPKAPQGVWSTDWPEMATEWASSLSLNAGINDGQAAIARLLTQLIPALPELDPSLPSLSEALAVLAGNTLMLSSLDAPFIHYWNYSTEVNTLSQPQYQAFNGTLRVQNYASGGTESWQQTFYVVLAMVFLINICTLVYFIFSGSLVTDFIEPQNLFALSLNSPPSAVLDGSCGGGPENEALDASWHIALDKDRDHLYIESREGVRKKGRGMGQQTDFEMRSPVARMYSQLGRKRTSFL